MDPGISSQLSSLEDFDENKEYFVEQIISRRIRMGQVEYFVKWQDFPDEDNTWELSKNLDCLALITEFESQRATKNNKRQAELKINEIYVAKAKKLKIEPSVIIDNAFEYGHKAEQILCASNIRGKISFVIKFRDLDQPEQVESQVAYIHIPMLVIQFYEEHLKILNAFSTNSSSPS